MAGILVPLGAFCMVSWIVYTIVTGLRRFHQQRVIGQFQAKLLDRIGSVNELGAFLNTEAGGRFLKGLSTVTESGAAPQARILQAVQGGAVLATMGVGLYLYGWLTPQIPSDTTNAINLIATILFATGAGLLGSAAVSYRLSKQMGLLASSDGQRRHESAGSTY